MLLSGEEYRESLRRYEPTIYFDGTLVDSVAEEPRLAPGIAAVGETHNLAKDARHRPLMVAEEQSSGSVRAG